MSPVYVSGVQSGPQDPVNPWRSPLLTSHEVQLGLVASQFPASLWSESPYFVSYGLINFLLLHQRVLHGSMTLM